ncbi:DUF2958 domain-containing protein [Demequina sp.]|uniref:DUF2958 domain-containing protein n=1 Tax=Demequina sp. TaxID=2050685 RepID=UPI003D134155
MNDQPLSDHLINTIEADVANAIPTIVHMAALLGSNSRWRSAADYLEEIANMVTGIVTEAGAPPVEAGEGLRADAALAYWRAVADEQGLTYDHDFTTTWPHSVNDWEREAPFYPEGVYVPQLRSTEDTPVEDKIIYLRYTLGTAEWLIAEVDPATGAAFGWAELIPGGGEWGHLDLTELEALLTTHGLPIERDVEFTATRFADLH